MQSVVEFYANVAYIAVDVVLILSAVYIVFRVKETGVRVFFNRGYKLKGKREHDFISWCFTLLVYTLFNYIDTIITGLVISLETDYLLRRKLFYLSKIFFFILLYMSLYALHMMRGCSFSAVTRGAYYLGLIPITLYMVQLISRGYYDVNVITSVNFRFLISLYATISCVLFISYPVKSLYQRYQKEN
ncbi:hypothetical protein [Pseudoalteromonas luteoviolacea]|uniref:Uncharacterized protein n=1 Tax=Pseudoalteromonas luteoviolacea S4060-1 TaxID=1365257 RepID=A0A162CK04_9GAMM|nr:hypothetical protein [Pseudoalteromonas luteoviolacea]KZN38719.1 hypothetical protein N480_13775 [Pseudoalteromonas luteoviolacea S2607]KZN69204.1 hypothetical protein N478_11265 [Pseudoalteromonas luteoviolacea S4060-1]